MTIGFEAAGGGGGEDHIHTRLALQDATQTIPSTAGGFDRVQFDTEVPYLADWPAEHVDMANSRVTTPTAGLYHVEWVVRFTTTTNETYPYEVRTQVEYRTVRGGNETVRWAFHNQHLDYDSGALQAMGSALVKVYEGGYIQTEVGQDSGIDVDIDNSMTATHMTVTRVKTF